MKAFLASRHCLANTGAPACLCGSRALRRRGQTRLLLFSPDAPAAIAFTARWQHNRGTSDSDDNNHSSNSNSKTSSSTTGNADAVSAAARVAAGYDGGGGGGRTRATPITPSTSQSQAAAEEAAARDASHAASSLSADAAKDAYLAASLAHAPPTTAAAAPLLPSATFAAVGAAAATSQKISSSAPHNASQMPSVKLAATTAAQETSTSTKPSSTAATASAGAVTSVVTRPTTSSAAALAAAGTSTAPAAVGSNINGGQNELMVMRKKSMKMAEIRRTAEDKVRDSFRHTRDTMPKTDSEGLLLCFSQGMTDYCWRAMPHRANVKEPRVLRGETTVNRVRLFGMPKGYPDTTALGFQRFFYISQASSFVSNFSSSIGYQSLLNGFFLGSSPQLWMLKDLVPALLAAYLANKVVSYENRPKFWFAVSVFMNNVSVISDMLIPKLFPQHLLVAAILTSTVKQSSALMFFVARAAALQHFATHNNLAELTKKFNSFGMVNYTIATALGIVYCTYVASFTVQLVTAVVCCALNMVLSPMSMNPIAFRILNFTTIELIMYSYVKDGSILSPDDVSQRLGVRMVAALPDDATDRHSLIYVSPPIDKLVIRSDTLDEDVLYVNDNGLFMLALWEPSPVPLTIRECWLRWELPGALQWARTMKSFWRTFRSGEGARKAELVFGGKRLVLLVHAKCTPRDLMTAYLIMFHATLHHATTELQLRAFLKECHRDQGRWQREATSLRDSLGLVNWDVNLMSIDHPNFRMSDLIVPPSMRPKPSSGSTGRTVQTPPLSSPSK